MLNLAAAESYRFWRIYIEDAANPDGYIEIGRMGLFVRYQAAELPDAGIIDDLEDATVISRSITGQTYADLGVKSRAYEINMGTMKEETRQSLKAIYAAAGQSGRIIFIPDEYNTDKLPPIYCCMKKTPKFTQAGGWLWKHESIRVVEEF